MNSFHGKIELHLLNKKMKVDFIIAGFQKCGTTALHTFLTKHPRVIGSKPKELDFFNYDVNYNKGSSYYHSKFNPKPIFSRLRGFKFLEASPSYANDSDALFTAKKIKEYNKDIKIILLIRNPIDRAYSAWNMYKNRFENGDVNWWFEWMASRTGQKSTAIRRTSEEYKNFTLFVKRELELVSENKLIECQILKNGNYTKGIKIYSEVFDKNLLITKNEELDSDTENTLNSVSDFLKLSNYNWAQFHSKKVFEGQYDKKIDKEAKELLYNYYKEEIKELYSITNISYFNEKSK